MPTASLRRLSRDLILRPVCPKTCLSSTSPNIRLDLDATRRLLAAGGDPQRRYDCVLIGGTNGKGSVATFLAQMAQSSGLRTGLFTSPRLVHREEQIRVDGEMISARHLDLLFEGLRETDPKATPFELLTVAALTFFAEEKVDLAVIEVGMGGARDSTNAVEPKLSVITNIGRDHRRFLGTDPLGIAREKAGILRAGRPAIFGRTSLETLEVLQEEASAVGAHSLAAEQIVDLEELPEESGKRKIRLQTPRHLYEPVFSPAGAWQAHHLALAVLAAEELGFSTQAILDGAAKCRRPGRMEFLHLPGLRPILLDAAHNVDAVEALVRELDALQKPFDLLFGALKDKEIDEMLTLLIPRTRHVIFTRPQDPKRSWDPHLYQEKYPKAHIVEFSEDALDSALSSASPSSDTPMLLACGSLRLVGDIRGHLAMRSDEMPPMW